MSSLQVLCPNGRRQNVKITPNTKLLQVLEEVCQKQKFLPAEDFNLIHGRTKVDLTLSVRFANLSNNAKLELVRAEKSRAETDVLIALQLEQGARLQHAFSPGTSLWDVLRHFEQSHDSSLKLTSCDESQTPSLHPVCVYMREEVRGELALRETQLRTLGLTGGKAALRFAHRPVEADVLADIKNKIEREKLRKSRLEQGTNQATGSAKLTSSSSKPDVNVQTSSSEAKLELTEHSQNKVSVAAASNATISLNINVNIQKDSGSDTKSSDSTEDKGEPVPKVGRMEESHDSEQPMGVKEKSHDHVEPMEVEHTEVSETQMETDDISKTEENTQVAADRRSQAVSERQAAADSLRALNIPGVEIFTPDDFADLTPDQQQMAQRLAAAIIPKLGLQQNTGATPRSQPTESKSARFTEFKFPESSKGKKLYQNELSEVRKEDFQPCERRALVYNVEEGVVHSESTEELDVPDDFFTVTDRDLKIMIADQKRKAKETDDQPLMTSAMRKAKLERQFSVYDRVVIRIQFQDKLVLQGVFRPRETVFAVQKFVKEFLEDKTLPFYLYTAPPKCVLKDVSSTLIEAQLVPATVVYFGCDQHKDHYLSETMLLEIRSKSDADDIVAECLNTVSHHDQPSTSDPGQTSSSRGKKSASSKSSSSSSSPMPAPSTSSSQGRPPDSSQGNRQDKGVPKWFKVGKK